MALRNLRQIDQEWAQTSVSVWSRRALRHWGRADERLAGFRDPDELVQAIRYRPRVESEPLCWALLELVAKDDDLAVRTLLQVFVPAMAVLLPAQCEAVEKYRLDAVCNLMAAAVQAIHETAKKTEPIYPVLMMVQRTRRLSWRGVKRDQQWQRTHSLVGSGSYASVGGVAAKFSQSMLWDDDPGRQTTADKTAADELSALFATVEAQGSIETEELALLFRTRVLGMTTAEVAEDHGCSAQAVRRRRNRAQRRFVSAAKQVA